MRPLTLTRKESESISLTRTIDRLHRGEPCDGLLAELQDQFERDGHRASDPMRPFIPWAALAAQRDFNVAGVGAYMVPTTPVTAYDTLRPYSVPIELGAQVLENLIADTPLPYLSGSSSGSWLSSENATQAPSDPTVSSKLLQPKTYAAVTSVSRHLPLQAPQSEPVIRRHLTRLTASQIDVAALNGSGASGQPTGLLTVSGTQSQSGTSLAEAGVTNMLQQAIDNGADDRRACFVSTPSVRELLQNRESVATTGVYIWRNNQLAGKTAYATAAMPSATMLCGDFTNLVIGFFGPGLELMADPFTAWKTGVVTIRCMVSVDVGVMFPASYCKSVSIT